MIVFLRTILTLVLVLVLILILAAAINPAYAITLTTSSGPHVLRYVALGIGAAVIIAAGLILYRKRSRNIST
jgi:hypothetical protein